MKKSYKILRIISSIDPEFGGPSKTAIETSLALCNQGFKVDIITSDPKNSNFYKSKKIKIINKGPRIGKYDFNINLFFWLLKHRHKYDFFIIEGMWQFNTLLARILLKNKYFVFVHGTIDPWFGKENFFKVLKKKIYWFLFEKKNLIESNSVLFTANKEKRLFKNTFVNTLGIKGNVIDFGIIKPKIDKKKALKSFYKVFPELKNKNFLLFLGRYHEKKGCEILIKSIFKLNKKKIRIFLLLAGPMKKTKYENYLFSLIKKFHLENQIIMSDALYDDKKWGAILASQAMVLSSYTENFGISLAESLCCSRPVLTTNRVNIYDEIKKFQSGLISNPNVKNFSKILKKHYFLNSNQRKKMRTNALICFNNKFNLSNQKNNLGRLLKKNIS